MRWMTWRAVFACDCPSTKTWQTLKTRKEVQERILIDHIGLTPQVLLSLQAQLDKIHKVAEEHQARSAVVLAMEVLWAKLRMPSGETQWARECLHYHVQGARDLLQKELVRLNQLLKAGAST